MSDRHLIRLRGPWWFAASGGDSGSRRFRFESPCDIQALKNTLGDDADVGIQLRRPFQWPQPIGPGQRIAIATEHWNDAATLYLNGQLMQPEQAGRSGLTSFPVTDPVTEMQPSNELTVVISAAPPDCESVWLGPFCLVIEPTG